MTERSISDSSANLVEAAARITAATDRLFSLVIGFGTDLTLGGMRAYVLERMVT